MQDYFSIIFKRILFWLIPIFLITNQKNSISCDNLKLTEDINIENELKKICKANKVLCPMTDAVYYSLNTIKTYSKTYEIQSENKELKYQNVKSKSLSCKNISSEIIIDKIIEEDKDEKYSISFSNCTSEMTGQLFINEYDETTFESELYFDKIIFIKRKNALNGEMNLLFEYNQELNKTFNYDRDYFLYYDDLIESMDIIMENVFGNYTFNFMSNVELNNNGLTSQMKYLGNIINKFTKQYSLFSPKIENNQNKLTYIGYNQFKSDSIININNQIYISNLSVIFEYALNYNITYNEGFIVLDYMNFSKIQTNHDIYIGNIINKSAEFDNVISPEESETIWNLIKSDFHDKLDKYKIK